MRYTPNTITRREAVSRLAGLAAGCAVGGRTMALAPEPPQRPLNVLFINSDQQRFDALSCAGSTIVSTPNLDRLAREGVRFSSAYTPSPVCVPARAAFMTGLSIHTSRCITRPTDPGMQFGSGTFDQNLVKHGYAAEYHGRWHSPMELTDCYANEVTLKFIEPYRRYLATTTGNKPETKPGQFVEEIGAWPYTPDAADFDLRTSQNNPPPHGVKGVRYGIDESPADQTYSAFVANETIAALERNRDKPFSITAAFLSPHHPMTVTRSFAEQVDPSKMQMPTTLRDQRLNTPYEKWVWQMDETDMAALSVLQARYYALVQEVDHHVGRILDSLDRLGLSENTLVIFISDHGEFMGDHGLMQKFLPYRESVRVPMLMRLPGRIPPGKVVDSVTNTRDLMETIFDYLELPTPEQEGHSLRPLVNGQSGYPEYTTSECGEGEGGYVLLATRDWKYVWTLSATQPDLLFDLNEDPQELNNLLGSNPKRGDYLERACKLRTTLLEWMESMNHPCRDRLAQAEIA